MSLVLIISFLFFISIYGEYENKLLYNLSGNPEIFSLVAGPEP